MWEALLRTTIMVMSTTTSSRFLKRLRGPVQNAPSGISSLTIRYADAGDTNAIDRLSQLDSRRAPRGVVLVAEIGDELWAAHSLDDGHTVADPFRPTGELVALLVERGRQLQRAARGRTQTLPRVWPKAGYDHPAWS
jgi:hypothetical protein